MSNSIPFLLRIVIITCAFALSPATLQAEIKLPSVFGDHMVLQQGQQLPVWGWAEPEESVTVSVAGQSKSTKAKKDGSWEIRISPLKVLIAHPTNLRMTLLQSVEAGRFAALKQSQVLQLLATILPVT
jgi:hypothetical protein